MGRMNCARLAEPLKYLVNADFDNSRCQPEFLGHDDAGPFVWIQIIVIQARGEARLHAAAPRGPLRLCAIRPTMTVVSPRASVKA